MDEFNKTQPFRWTSKREHAALLLAQDELSDEGIAKALGINRTTLHNWKQHPDFQAQIGDNVGQIQAAMLKLAIAKKHKRLEVLNDLYERYLTIIEERGNRFIAEMADTSHQGARRIFGNPIVGEAITGLVAKKETPTNTGSIVTEWTTDTALTKEIRALQEQAAKELGQWVERSEVEQRTSVVQLVGVDVEAI